MKSNRQKQRFCHPKMADLKAWSHGVRKANCVASCNKFIIRLAVTCHSYADLLKFVQTINNKPVDKKF